MNSNEKIQGKIQEKFDIQHEPENAEHELRKAYNCAVEHSMTYFWDRKNIEGVNPNEVVKIYKRAMNAYEEGKRLAAERWARTAKHLSFAFWHEAKITFLEKHQNELTFLKAATPDEYNLHEHSDTTADLLDSVSKNITDEHMRYFLLRARGHLLTLDRPEYKHELLRAERLKAAHEYARMLECMTLAYEAESIQKVAA
ncbi:MAG: hypothetical protein AABZ06_10005 [Bdellovibrionota bacterium]